MGKLRRPRPPVDPALPALRRRTSWLLASAPPKLRALVRLLPLLLCTRFRRPSLETEPPGIARAPRRRRWSRLCEALDLPPPNTWYPLRPLLQSVILAPTAERGFELLFIPIDELSVPELNRVSARVDAIRQIAQRHAPGLEVRMAGRTELTPSLFAWAAVVAGDVPALPEDPTFDWSDVFARAPTELLRCLTLMVPRDAPSPLMLLQTGLAPSGLLAFVARWSGEAVARDVAALSSRPLSPPELDGLSRQLRGACLQALRRVPPAERAPIRKLLRPALFSSRIPAVLRPSLERILATAHPQEVQVDGAWQLQLDGLVLAQGASLDQLRAAALAESPRLTARGAPWSRVAQLLSSPRPRALALIEPGFLRHLVVVIPKSGRPRARRVDAPGLLRFVLTWHRAGVPMELIPAHGCDPTLIARASQVLGTPLSPQEHVGFQVGSRVLLIHDRGPRLVALERAFRRPRQLTWVPEQAEALTALRRPLANGLPTVQVVAFPAGQHDVALLSVDSHGTLFREQVPRSALESTVQEYREILRRAEVPTLISATVHPLLTSLAGRRLDEAPPVLMSGAIGEHGDSATLDGEVFGAGAELPWSALAEAVLSHWAPGTSTHVGLTQIAAPAGTTALGLLACRSRILRRLDTHLRRIARFLKAA